MRKGFKDAAETQVSSFLLFQEVRGSSSGVKGLFVTGP